MYGFSDAQAVYPERFTLALLEDARRTAEQASVSFQLLTYHRAKFDGRAANIAPIGRPGQTAFSFIPSAIVNATGAWVDRTLSALEIPSPRLIGGTKGSHLVTYHPELRDRLAGRGIYVEAADGRPVFVLPFGNGTLVGTTDLVYDDDPAQAQASPEELEYLLNAVNDLFSDLRLSQRDIEMHYSGVRPLPYVGPQTPSAVTRRHLLQPNPDCPVPFYSIIGGKLTTCRSLAEESAATILARLGLPHDASSRDRALPGGEAYPAEEAALANAWQRLADRLSLPREVVATVWSLIGTRTEIVLDELAREAGDKSSELVAEIPLPRNFVRWVIRNEWATTLDDLVERRLMLLYHPNLSRETLLALARLLADCGKLRREEIDREVDATIERLRSRFGKRVSR
jgi:glycerol-3-phosphate dehydrogenase